MNVLHICFHRVRFSSQNTFSVHVLAEKCQKMKDFLNSLFKFQHFSGLIGTFLKFSTFQDLKDSLPPVDTLVCLRLFSSSPLSLSLVHFSPFIFFPLFYLYFSLLGRKLPISSSFPPYFSPIAFYFFFIFS
jgi:hypothetical protein